MMKAMTDKQRAVLLQCPKAGEFLPAEGTRRDALRGLVSRGLLRVTRCDKRSYSKYIKPIFGRVFQTKSYTYFEVRYEMTDAGRNACEQVTA